MATTSTTDLAARKNLGQAYLGDNRVEEALRVYASILRDHPDDVDSYLVLGDCYLAEGDSDTAIVFYTQALSQSPDNPDIHRRLRLAELEYRKGPGAQEKRVPTDTAVVARMLQHLTGRQTPVSEEEVRQAAALLDEIIHHPHPAQAVAAQLERVSALLPALLELNIRQARSDGRPDLAAALQNLLENIHLQLDSSPEPAPQTPPRILYLAPERSEADLFPAGPLRQAGCQITSALDVKPAEIAQSDIVVAYRPHSNLRLMEGLAACAAAKLPIVLLLDADYEQMPVDHPDYETLGLGAPARAKAYAIALLLADLVAAPSENLAATLRAAGHRVKVFPAGWSRQNGLWEKPPASRNTINLGWVGNAGQVEDLAEVRRVALRVLREFPQTRLVISGDARSYQLFESLPEARRLFLPAVGPDDYPYLLAQVDILLAPLRNSPFNRSLNDRALLEAGVRGIPWVATPIPAYSAWAKGGLLANSPDEWHTALRQLVIDPELRISLGQDGKRQAAQRAIEKLGHGWFTALQEIILAKQAAAPAFAASCAWQ